jgi:FtsP/CotA-like multicopper oxidase with cupredoxin domain
VRVIGTLLLTIAPVSIFAQTNANPHNPCPRFAAGSLVSEPPSLYSSNGLLLVNLSYNATTDSAGRPLYCFTTPDGVESPTLYVKPGDTLTVVVKNNLPAPTSASTMAPVTNAPTVCGASAQNASSVNVHYHGTNTSPTCHSDEVIHTLINSGQTFTYNINFPINEPPGLYWYHPHVHGLAESAVQGGASAAIVVQGIQNVQPAVAGLPQRILIVRDQIIPSGPMPGGSVPSWDLSVNYVPILYPALTPAQLVMRPGEKQFWRVSNSCADTILDLEAVYDGVAQTIQIVGLDGVPTGSQDGSSQGKLVPVTHIRVPPASRVEFILTAPAATVKTAVFRTLGIDTGPDGDSDPQRDLIAIHTSPNAPEPASAGNVDATPGPQRFAGLSTATVTAQRHIYFSENNPVQQFFITVDGQTPTLFSANLPPAIVTTQGSVEDWTIENRALENHEFHFHQIHFLLLERNGVPVPPDQQQFLDMVEVPYSASSTHPPYSSVKVRMDFRGPDIGDFVYHCHILNHEDNGMMAIIRVLPPGPTAAGGVDANKPPEVVLQGKPAKRKDVGLLD